MNQYKLYALMPIGIYGKNDNDIVFFINDDGAAYIISNGFQKKIFKMVDPETFVDDKILMYEGVAYDPRRFRP